MPETAAGTVDDGAGPQVGRRRRTLAVACGTHSVHDGFSDVIFLFLPLWQVRPSSSHTGFLAESRHPSTSKQPKTQTLKGGHNA